MWYTQILFFTRLYVCRPASMTQLLNFKEHQNDHANFTFFHMKYFPPFSRINQFRSFSLLDEWPLKVLLICCDPIPGELYGGSRMEHHHRQLEGMLLTWTGSPVGITMAVGGGRGVTVLVMAGSLGSWVSSGCCSGGTGSPVVGGTILRWRRDRGSVASLEPPSRFWEDPPFRRTPV